jgi:hypothetical protein
MKARKNSQLEITIQPCRREGICAVTASDGKRVVHSAKGDVSSSKFRREFAESLCECARGVRANDVIRQLESLVLEKDRASGARSDAMRDRLLAIGETAELFASERAGRKAAFATIRDATGIFTCPIHSVRCAGWIREQFRKSTGTTATASATKDVLDTLEGAALSSNRTHQVAVRVGGDTETIFIDTGSDGRMCIRVDRDGWDVVPAKKCPVRFVRPEGQNPLPAPVQGGSLDDLWPLVNVQGHQRKPFAGWLAYSLTQGGPYPILVVNGEPGSAKSTLCRIARDIIDPNVAPLRLMPRSPGDVILAARNSRVIAYDNLSSMSHHLMDCLCSLATGTSISTRQLYSDDQEVLLTARRPVIINGIDDLCTRSDVADRAVQLILPPISPENRRCEAEIERAVAACHDRVLGAVLDGVASMIRNREVVSPARLSRMADFEKAMIAAEEGFGWKAGSAARALSMLREGAHQAAIDDSPIGRALVALVRNKRRVECTASELLRLLRNRVSDEQRRQRGFPLSNVALAKWLRRLAPSLRGVGVDVDCNSRTPDRRRKRLVRLTWRNA